VWIERILADCSDPPQNVAAFDGLHTHKENLIAGALPMAVAIQEVE
jgi:hypothetical protein